eukprot:m.375667 g.375667  ORF g.375667 m.375667 type:complete len:700 (+) comp20922_c0_seq1:190-2289(+)
MLRVTFAKSMLPLRVSLRKLGSLTLSRGNGSVSYLPKNRSLSTRGTTSAPEQSNGTILAVGGAVFVGVAIASYRSSNKNKSDSKHTDTEYQNRLSTPTPKDAQSVSETHTEKDETSVSVSDAESSLNNAPEAKPPKPVLSRWLRSKYVIVGTGTAAFFAVRGILESEPDAEILLIGEEDHVPYMRTPLSKELWFRDSKGDISDSSSTETRNPNSDLDFVDWGGKKRSIFYEPEDFYTDPNEFAPAKAKMPEKENIVSSPPAETTHSTATVDSSDKKEGTSDSTTDHINETSSTSGNAPVDTTASSTTSSEKTPQPKVGLVRGHRVVDMNINAKRLLLDNGTVVNFNKCLLATGGKPRTLPVLASADEEVLQHVSLFRNIDDFRKVSNLMTAAKDIVVVGGGFLGSELAVAMAHHGKQAGVNVTQVFPEHGNMAKVLPQYLSEWSTARVQDEGVTVVPNTRVTGVTAADANRVTVALSSGETLEADEVVVAVGIAPDTDLARKARLEIDAANGGVVVNAELEARTDVWVAGDAASFYDTTLGRMRVEHHDHATVSGRLAGANMAGAQRTYRHPSMFWSDLGPHVGYEAIGVVDASLPTVGVWAAPPVAAAPPKHEPTGDSAPTASADGASGAVDAKDPAPTAPLSAYHKGVVLYVRDNAVVGVVTWNLFGKIPLARKLIRSERQCPDKAELAQLFEVHKA